MASNSTEAHNFYYRGVDHGIAKRYCGCSLSYDGRDAYSYSTIVAKVIPTKHCRKNQISTSDRSSGLTLVSYFSMSSTTGRHISLLTGASPFPVIRVPMERGSKELTPCDLRDNFLETLEGYMDGFNKRETRDRFVYLMQERMKIITLAPDEWAKPLRDMRFGKFEKIDITKAAEELKARNRKEASKRAAETKALFAKYVKDRHGADYCEFVHALINGWYDSKKYPFTNEERRMLQRKLDKNAAYIWTEGDTVVTSRGVRVGVDQAKVLLKAWAAGKDMRGLKIGNYTIVSYTGNTIKIGCHDIPRENMIALYEALIGKPFPEKQEAVPE